MESATSCNKSIKEGKAEICLTSEKVFYNPVQEFNRDLSIAVLSIFCEDYRNEKLEKVKRKKEGDGDSSEVRMYFLLSEILCYSYSTILIYTNNNSKY